MTISYIGIIGAGAWGTALGGRGRAVPPVEGEVPVEHPSRRRGGGRERRVLERGGVDALDHWQRDRALMGVEVGEEGRGG